ncbi:hypothetical protein K4K48_002973 [Colletotrichum sp. SAR 10_66]|nr:hypothetical protein K4K48_002973 [Colletotrichum sp. SAR 10_66]
MGELDLNTLIRSRQNPEAAKFDPIFRILEEGLVRIVVDTDKAPAFPLLYGDRVSLLVLRLPRGDSTTSTPLRVRICVAHLSPVLPKLYIATRADTPIGNLVGPESEEGLLDTAGQPTTKSLAKGQFAERPGGQMDEAASKRLLFWA